MRSRTILKALVAIVATLGFTVAVPSAMAQEKKPNILVTIPQYPFQEGSSLNAAGINYMSLKAAALKRLQELESLSPPRN